MSSTNTASVISDDGLRYSRGKPSGSQVVPTARPGAMSCFKCGTFRPVSELVSKRLFGTNQKFCKEGCKRP